jgi:hypothetical protein
MEAGDCSRKPEKMSFHCPSRCEALQSHLVARSPVYELMTQGRLSDDSIGLLAMAVKASGAHPMETLPLNMFQARWDSRAMQSAYAVAMDVEPRTCSLETLDYIFFLPGQTLKLGGVIAPPANMDYLQTIRRFGSDHLPLIADFAIMGI